MHMRSLLMRAYLHTYMTLTHTLTTPITNTTPYSHPHYRVLYSSETRSRRRSSRGSSSKNFPCALFYAFLSKCFGHLSLVPYLQSLTHTCTGHLTLRIRTVCYYRKMKFILFLVTPH